MLAFDLDDAAITRDEHTATATLAVAAWLRNKPMPMASPLQRSAARATVRAYTNHCLEQMRARVH